MYKNTKLLSISSSLPVKFIIDRFSTGKSYRGKHFLQHSRTPIDQLVSFLIEMNKIVGTDWMRIPVADEFHPIKNPKGYKLASYSEYESFVIACSFLPFSAKSSSQSLKKITFVDLHRMGLLERAREGRSGENIFGEIGKRFKATKVCLTNEAINIINESNKTKWPSQMAAAFKRAWGSEYDILYKLIFIENLKYITIEEYVFFVSWINYDGNSFEINDCVNLIKQYRNLSKNTRESIELFFKENSKGNLSKGNANYWDWGNWKNEAASIFEILGATGLLIFNKKTKKIEATFTTTGTFKRLKNIIQDYDGFHKITKEQKDNSGFEYHHIIPFSWIEKEADHTIIDSHFNLIYISGTKHNQIPKRNNTFVNFEVDGDSINLVSNNNRQKIVLEINKDVYISKDKLEMIKKYNKDALSSLL